jgi:hypothetical protein
MRPDRVAIRDGLSWFQAFSIDGKGALARPSEDPMCELFAMSTRYPSTVQLSLEEFSRHGGLFGPHKDGWGIA